MGVNGQILVSYAALRGFAWTDYIAALQDGLERFGPVRAGVYAETGVWLFVLSAVECVESHPFIPY